MMFHKVSTCSSADMMKCYNKYLDHTHPDHDQYHAQKLFIAHVTNWKMIMVFKFIALQHQHVTDADK